MSSDTRPGILIITDDWHPRFDGVVNTLTNLQRELDSKYRFDVLYPDREKFIIVHPFLQFPDVPWVVAAKDPFHGKVGDMIDQINPDFIYNAVPEGSIGFSGIVHCVRRHLNFNSGHHTNFWKYAEGTPEFLTDRGYDYSRWAHGKANCTLTPEAMIPELTARGFEHLVALDRGVDTDKFRPLKPGEKSIYEEMGLKPPYLLYAGRVDPAKGVEEFIAAKWPGTKVVVGKGSLLAGIEKNHPEIVCLGFKEHDTELPPYFRGADVLAFPSNTDTFGQVQIEMMASGGTVAVRPNEPSAKIGIGTVPGIGAMNDNYTVACEEALRLREKNGGVPSREHVLEHYNGWGSPARVFENHLVPARGPKPGGRIYSL